MTLSSKFSIQVNGALIVVNLTGDWTEQDDLLYISSLAEKISDINRDAWGLLVDMRGWKVQEVAQEPTFKISLDRRNQKVECWIVDDQHQGDFLLTQFKDAPVTPVKFLNPTEAIKRVEKLGFTLPNYDILNKG